MAILILFQKFSSPSSSEWLAEIQKNGVDSALTKFCKEIPVSPQKVLKVAFGIRGLSSSYISRVFLKTEMILRSKNVVNGSRQLVRSRSSENLPNSQSQNNIQMVSHTLTIREVSFAFFVPSYIYFFIRSIFCMVSILLLREDISIFKCMHRCTTLVNFIEYLRNLVFLKSGKTKLHNYRCFEC